MIKITKDGCGQILKVSMDIGGYYASIPYNPITKSIDWEEIKYAPTREAMREKWNSWISRKQQETGHPEMTWQDLINFDAIIVCF